MMPLNINSDTTSIYYHNHTDLELFRKYKEGRGDRFAPFKLFGITAAFTHIDSEDFIPSQRIRGERGPYRKYSHREKQQAVKCIEDGQDVTIVAKRYNIPRRNLLRWKKYGCERKEIVNRGTVEDKQHKLLKKIKKQQLTDEKLTNLRQDEIAQELQRCSKQYNYNTIQNNQTKVSEVASGSTISCQFQ